jgi:diguanylate cyclase (GGDEF)-like protein/PAS domain S-box-containing protein
MALLKLTLQCDDGGMSNRVLVESLPAGGIVKSRHRFISSGWWWGAALVALVALSVVHLKYPVGVAGQLSYTTVTAAAAVAAWFGARRHSAPWRFPWICVAAAVGLSAIGDAIYYTMGFFNGTLSSLSVADGLWLGNYAVLAVGLSSLVVGGRGRGIDVDGLIDIGSFAVLAIIVVTQFNTVHDLMINTSYPLTTRMVWTAYPILDATLLGVVIQAIVSKRLRGRRGVFVSCGVALWLISDFASLLITASPSIFKWLDIGWMVGAASLAVAAWPVKATHAHPQVAFKPARVTDSRILITLLPLLVPGIIKIWEFSHGHNPNPLPLFGATVTLLALAFARSTRLVKARNVQEAALERSTHFYAALAENSSDAVIVVDAGGHILNDAPNLATMLGHAGEPTVGMDAVGLLRPLDRQGARNVLDRWWLNSGVVDDGEVQAPQADGTDRWFGIRAANLSDDPVVGGMVLNLRDITDRKRAEQELSHSAFHDSLTGLANRALFNDRLQHALERTARTGFGVAIVYLDLDGFKMVNDSSGHEAGDQVLREVAARLDTVVRTVDTVARLGGDEFAILIEESPRALDEAQTVAERVLQSLTAPFMIDAQSVVLSASVGIAIGDISCTASAMLRDADVAMYKAKTTGKSKWALYEPGMRTAALDRLELENDLRQAVENQQFRLVYQPVIELESNNVVGFEALLRWDHPVRGVVGPAAFIPIAEANGAIIAIGQWVLEEACRTAAQWHRANPAVQLTMAVNLSARQIATPDIVAHVAAALEHSGFAAASLILEMTESVLVQDAKTAGRRLQELRALGVRLAIDDFGTGYSSLSYLRQFPIDILKVDKSFTDTITDGAQVPAIVRGLLDLAKTLRMQTVAEGIELEVQLVSLRDEHCDFGQGFLFAKPLDAIDAATLVGSLQPVLQSPAGSR